ncbi:unnamed protein product [Brassica oleracea]|uniref:(rape) hypothetical protein n=1 Tax=Brassica napus TaxID=3708 RepID=A0A816JW50_BRANA|nr:unnamed protein product [Brassica napus]
MTKSSVYTLSDHVAGKLICLVHVNLYTFQCVLAGKLYLNGTSAKHNATLTILDIVSSSAFTCYLSSQIARWWDRPVSVFIKGVFIKCVSCNETNAVAELRYCVILSVSDDTGTTAFHGIDTEVAKLTHVLASEAAQIVGIGANAQVDIELSRSLADLVGSTYTFQFKLKDFNFTPNHQTFTISRIFPARVLAQVPTFAEGGEVTEPALPQSVAPGSDDRAANTYNVADQLNAADGAQLGHEAVASGEVDVEETARKKARVE